MKSFRVWFIDFGFIVLASCVVADSGWLNHFKNYIVSSNNAHQVMILFDENKAHVTKIKDIIQGMSRNLPTLKISFQDAIKRNSKELRKQESFGSPQTTVTVLIHLSEDSGYLQEVNGPIEFVSQLSEPRRRSRFLIILPQEQESFTYVKLLQRLWSKQFLDVTILELIDTQSDEENHFFIPSKEIAMIHQYNPFTKSYTRIRHGARLSWFPDKTQNLHGYPLKVGLLQVPPLIFVERNETGDVTKVYGPDAQLTQGLSKAINFNIRWISPENETDWGSITCFKNASTGHTYRLMNNEIQFVVYQRGRYGSCDENLMEWSSGTKFNKIVAVIHITTDDSVQASATWKKLNASVISVLFLTIWFLSKMLGFDSSTWGLLSIMQIVLGLTAPREPQKLAERMLFGAILASCMLHSSFIYTAFTDVSLAENSAVEINTIEQLLSLTFHPIIQKGLYTVMAHNVDGNAAVLLNKAMKVSNSSTCCALLLNEKNRTCVLRLDVAKWLVETNRDSSGRPILKIVDESLSTNPTELVLEPRSPYARRFHEVTRRLVQSGLVEKWQRNRFNTSSKENLNDSGITRGSESILLRKQVAYVFWLGHAFAMITFLCEVLLVYLKKMFNLTHSQNGRGQV